MDFRLSSQQQMLVTIAREFLDKHCPPALVQELAHDARGVPEPLWQEIAKLGWPGLLIPPEMGGSGGALLDVALLVEEMGRACFPGPFVPSAVVATTALLEAGSRAQQERVLPAMALGERIATTALAEESASFEPSAIRLPGEVGGTLDGRKLFVKDAHLAHHLIVLARGGGAFNLLLIDRERPGVTLVPLDVLSGEKLFEVAFADVRVRDEDLLGAPGRGWDLLAPALRAGALARTAEMVGSAQRILELAVDYAKVRVQSGRPIGAFQAIQHTLADLLRNVEGARWLLRSAAWKATEGLDAGADVAMAKAYAGEACLAVARRAHQVFGAIGYCEEHPLHLHHKRIHAASLDFGDAALHLETVAGAIGLM